MSLIPSLMMDAGRALAWSTLKRAAGLVTRRLPIAQPTLLVGAGASARLGQAVARFGHRKILVVTDRIVARLGLPDALTRALARGGTAYLVFDQITADAPLAEIERGIAAFQTAGCDAIVAVGGGSVIDAAKAIGLAVANDKHPRQLVGFFRGRHGPVPLYAVPTTAGTGSEVTVAAVISDPQHQQKLLIADTRLVPRMAALDPTLMTGLPPEVTAATGMDALTHAVEAYIGQWSTPESDRMALAAVGLIYENLRTVCQDGGNLGARENMALAASYAGLAFTRANVGYVHAIAHQLGGRYHTPHGLANAIVLPHVLDFYRPVIDQQLAVLAIRSHLGQASEAPVVLAQKFLDSIRTLNRELGIPSHLDALRKADIAALARAACQEADTHYPVPRYMPVPRCEALLRQLLTPARQRRARAPPRR